MDPWWPLLVQSFEAPDFASRTRSDKHAFSRRAPRFLMTSIGVRRDQGAWARRARRLLPTTKAGRLACWFAFAFLAMFFLNQVVMGVRQSLDVFPRAGLIVYGWALLACGLTAGVVGTFAVVRRRERSVLVFLTMLPGIMVLTFLLGELLVPH